MVTARAGGARAGSRFPLEAISYDGDHKVVVCRPCKTCLTPNASSWKRHFRGKPHWLKGDELRTTVEKLGSYEVRTEEELGRQQQQLPCQAVAGLVIYDGYYCLQDGCGFTTRKLQKLMYEHVPQQHGRRARDHTAAAPLWRECRLQTYFTAKSRIRYFEVVGSEAEDAATAAERNESTEERKLFAKLEGDTKQAKEEVELQGETVRGFETSKTERIPWLATLGFPAHLNGLKDGEIRTSCALPPKHVLEGVTEEEEEEEEEEEGEEDNKQAQAQKGRPGGSQSSPAFGRDMIRILNVAEGMLQDGYKLCSDMSTSRRMTQQRAKILNEFYSGAAGKPTVFRHFKNASSLRKYFSVAKRLLVYFLRVVVDEGGHFTRPLSHGSNASTTTANTPTRLPKDVIEPTQRQLEAVGSIEAVLRREDEGRSDETEAALKHAVRKLYMALICHTVGSEPFRSPVLSFCAMLSRKVYCRGAREGGKRRAEKGQQEGGEAAGSGIWEEAGNYNSNLSALTWTAQMIIFDYVCHHEQEDDNKVPETLRKICQRFFQQQAETPFGYILQWRLYLFATSKTTVSKRQARWSVDGRTIEFLGVRLEMRQIGQLVGSIYREAHTLLHESLLLRAGVTSDRPASIESWKIEDDLDADDFGGSWLTNTRNAKLLRGSEHVLLQRIRDSAELRQTFVRDRAGGGGGKMLCAKAINLYEVYVQRFLRLLAVLIHLTPGPPLRAPELLSATVRNTARQRHIFVRENLVMLHVQYHKGQEQTGTYKDNIRFLPRAVGDLLLTYMAYVPPLRQTFLRQLLKKKSGDATLLSPYLWSRLDGRVWKDESLSICLRKACALAGVPQFQTGWWRQVAASITKEKFSSRDRDYFERDGEAGGEDIEDETDLVHLARMSNHSLETFNRAYAGTTNLTMSMLITRSYRASESWRNTFGFDQIFLAQVEGGGRRKRRRRTTSSSGGTLDSGMKEGEDEDESEHDEGLARDSKRMRYRPRRVHTEASLLEVARRLYDDPQLQFRGSGQRGAVLAMLGPQAADQVVTVLGTGSGKTLAIMIAAALEDAGTTILVLPTVALRGDMTGRMRRVDIKPQIWKPGTSAAGPLVIVSAEAATTQGFLAYAMRLAAAQELERIVVDESHLTITASCYRQSMSELAWFVCQIPTQTVWLTATLPPVLQEKFMRQNYLTKPCIVRAPTNRANIRYLVRQGSDPRCRGGGGGGTLIEQAARLVRTCWLDRGDLFQDDRDRIIVYCRTKEQVFELAEILGCPSYTADSGTAEEKDQIISRWLATRDPPAIVATSALGPGFDYAHVRQVIHVGAPGKMTDFAQESGRAGRDGQHAESIVLLRATWEPDTEKHLGPDEEAMQLYLTQKQCYRGILSQFLDECHAWRWCMDGEDEACGSCGVARTTPRPDHIEFRLGKREEEEGGKQDIAAAREREFLGPKQVLLEDRLREAELSGYEKELEIMKDCCLYCRVRGKPFEHAVMSCADRWDWIRAKGKALKACRQENKQWMERYVVCWKCYQPQGICRAADPDVEDEDRGDDCRFRDVAIPLSYGLFYRAGRTQWLQKHFQRTFKTELEYMIWLGETSTLGGKRCIQANCVAALLLAELK